jgi:hypothetical protein
VFDDFVWMDVLAVVTAVRAGVIQRQSEEREKKDKL